MKAKSYCIAFGCLNNNKNRNLTFFSLPKDIERRRKWLTVIDRPDLLQKEDLKRKTNVVCSVHFEDSSIKVIKHLKDDAVPTRFLPKRPQEGVSSSEAQSTSAQIKGKEIISSNDVIKRKKYFTVGTQTEILQSPEKQTPTSQSLTDADGTRIKRQRIDQEIMKIKNELEE